jgi:hypothetical protein
MTTPPGWEHGPGPARGEQARRAPREAASWPPDDADPQRPAGRGERPANGRGWDRGTGGGPGARGSQSPAAGPGGRERRGEAPRFTPNPGRPTPRDGAPVKPRDGAPVKPRDGAPAQPRDASPVSRQRAPGERAALGSQGRRPPASNRNGRPGGSPGAPPGRGPDGQGQGRGPGLPASPLGSLGSGPLRWIGTLSLRTAVLVLAGAALLGIVFTLIAGQDPGGLLAVFIIAGTIAAALGIRRAVVYLLFPMPAIAFFVAAVVAGIAHNSHSASSTASLGTSFVQWIAGVFFPMVIATILAILVGGGRWLLGSQLISGQSPRPAPRPSGARPAPGARRPPAADSWVDDSSPGRPQNPRPGTGPSPRPGTGPSPRQGTGPAPQQGTGPSPRPGTGPAPQQGTGPSPRPGTGPVPQRGAGPWPGNGEDNGRPARPPRDRGAERDPWGDPRLPPTGPRAEYPGRPPADSRDRGAHPSQDSSWPSHPQPPGQRGPRQPPSGWQR